MSNDIFTFSVSRPYREGIAHLTDVAAAQGGRSVRLAKFPAQGLFVVRAATLRFNTAKNSLATFRAFFERQRVFREYYGYFNFRRFNLVSKDDNVDGYGREEDTALNGHTIGTIQGHVAIDGALARQMLGEAPANDQLAIVFVRVGVLGTGGGGIATIGGRSAKTTIHEWGHAFARLGDEYSSKTHDRGGVSESVNVSAFEDPEKVSWAHWIAAKVPGVGMYEGASGQARDAWKPTSGGCVMESGEFFCEPCREAIVLRIYSLVDPIDSASPEPHTRRHAESLRVEDALEFEVQVLRPDKHDLEVRWWVLPEQQAPQDPRGRDERYRSGFRNRRARGPLSLILHDPVETTRPDRDGVHRLRVKAKDLEPGRHRVVCRVRDTTKMRGERFPWVLRDERGVLESERAWWIDVPDPENGDGDG